MIQETILGVIKGDTRSLDYRSFGSRSKYCKMAWLVSIPLFSDLYNNLMGPEPSGRRAGESVET